MLNCLFLSFDTFKYLLNNYAVLFHYLFSYTTWLYLRNFCKILKIPHLILLNKNIYKYFLNNFLFQNQVCYLKSIVFCDICKRYWMLFHFDCFSAEICRLSCTCFIKDLSKSNFVRPLVNYVYNNRLIDLVKIIFHQGAFKLKRIVALYNGSVELYVNYLLAKILLSSVLSSKTC